MPTWAKMLCLTAIILLIFIGNVFGQNIIFTTAHLRVHSVYDADTTPLRETVKDFSTNLSTHFSEFPIIEAKAIACSKLLDHYVDTHRSVADHHFTIENEHRQKKGVL